MTARSASSFTPGSSRVKFPMRASASVPRFLAARILAGVSSIRFCRPFSSLFLSSTCLCARLIRAWTSSSPLEVGRGGGDGAGRSLRAWRSRLRAPSSGRARISSCRASRRFRIWRSSSSSPTRRFRKRRCLPWGLSSFSDSGMAFRASCDACRTLSRAEIERSLSSQGSPRVEGVLPSWAGATGLERTARTDAKAMRFRGRCMVLHLGFPDRGKESSEI